MLDLVPPKPTKEFHEAYLEIYGKGKKRSDTVVQKPLLDVSSLDALDAPPMKKETEPQEIQQKKSFFSFMNKEKKALQEKQFSGLNVLELPPLKPLPPSLPTKQKTTPLISDLDKLDLPPLKVNSAQQLSSSSLPSIEKATIESPAKQIEAVAKKAPLYDFLAEIKHGKRQVIEPEPMKKSSPFISLSKKIPPFTESESVFEKTTAEKGARDMQIALEHESFGTEELFAGKPIPSLPSLPLSSPSSHAPLFSFEEAVEKMPKMQAFKSSAEFKQYLKQAKEYEQKLKQLNNSCKKSHQEVAALLGKQRSHDTQLSQKINKLALLEKQMQKKQEQEMKKLSLREQEILQKEEELKLYEPRMQEIYKREDALALKEKDIQNRQQDIHSTEARLKAEENSIVAKIKRLEADQKLLETEQNAIVKSVQKLEQDKEQIALKTKEFSDIMKRITAAEKELKERTDLFVERNNCIKRKEQLVEKEVARLATLKKKSEKLKEVEQTYERMKKRLRDAYEEYEQRFATHESYAPQKIEPTVKQIEQPIPSFGDIGDITNLIAITRNLVFDKKYEEANRNITKLMHRYMQIPDTNPRKKEIYYEILTVKNMLKLDLLD